MSNLKNYIEHSIGKVLSHNDLGLSGTHQAGIHIPKNQAILSYFPNLGRSEKNPRVKLRFLDDNDFEWFFNFIYYNNKFFNGTRNEYRLTCMTSYLEQNDLKVGDEIFFSLTELAERRIWYEHADQKSTIKDGVIRLSNSWKIINIKEN